MQKCFRTAGVRSAPSPAATWSHQHNNNNNNNNNNHTLAQWLHKYRALGGTAIHDAITHQPRHAGGCSRFHLEGVLLCRLQHHNETSEVTVLHKQT